jgi:hypothetical protein
MLVYRQKRNKLKKNPIIMLQISNIEEDDNKLTVYFKTDNCYLNHSEIQINTEHSVRQQKINNNDMLKYLVDNLINIFYKVGQSIRICAELQLVRTRDYVRSP